MPRPPVPYFEIVPDGLQGADLAIIALGMTQHNTNVFITNMRWHELKELAVLRGCTVSDVVRGGLGRMLAEADEELNGRTADIAVLRLTHEVGIKEIREQQ